MSPTLEQDCYNVLWNISQIHLQDIVLCVTIYASYATIAGTFPLAKGQPMRLRLYRQLAIYSDQLTLSMMASITAVINSGCVLSSVENVATRWRPAREKDVQDTLWMPAGQSLGAKRKEWCLHQFSFVSLLWSHPVLLIWILCKLNWLSWSLGEAH